MTDVFLEFPYAPDEQITADTAVVKLIFIHTQSRLIDFSLSFRSHRPITPNQRYEATGRDDGPRLYAEGNWAAGCQKLHFGFHPDIFKMDCS